MDRIAQLDAIVAQYDLNTHPFYTAWRAGTLPMDRLTDYSGEYGRFVDTIADGWETLGYPDYAAEERDHAVMWRMFQKSVGLQTTRDYAQTEVLEHSARTLFNAGPAEALGALYAFESQQPHTSRSKLDGLREHYAIDEAGHEYFVVHADDVHEVEDLRARTASLTDAEFNRAKSACATVCVAMWSALDGVLA